MKINAKIRIISDISYTVHESWTMTSNWHTPNCHTFSFFVLVVYFEIVYKSIVYKSKYFIKKHLTLGRYLVLGCPRSRVSEVKGVRGQLTEVKGVRGQLTSDTLFCTKNMFT